MKTRHEFDIRRDCWSGAAQRIERMPEEFIDRLESYLEDFFASDEEIPTDTQVNDIIWFEDELISEWFGFSSTDQMEEYFDKYDEYSGTDGMYWSEDEGTFRTEDDLLEEFESYTVYNDDEPLEFDEWLEENGWEQFEI